MGCINTKVSRVFEACNSSVRPIITVFAVIITFVSSMVVKIAHHSTDMEVAITTEEERPVVNVGLVCTVQLSEELEMWWCEGWKALWNNSKKILWRTE